MKDLRSYLAILATMLAVARLDLVGETLRSPFESMQDNAWLKLDPKGMAKARTYSGACFGGGFLWYFGGAHRGYKGNDVQLYDPRSNEWIQATEPEWPPEGSEDWKSMVSGGGNTKSLSPKGHPYTEHTYQQVCWQPDRNRFFVVLTSSGTWEFDPATRRWIHLINKFEGKKFEPRAYWSGNHVVYDFKSKSPVLICNSGNVGVYRFDHQKVEWRKIGEPRREVMPGELYSTYVPEWSAFLASSPNGFAKFDPSDLSGASAVETPDELKACQALAYDEANRVVVALAQIKVNQYRQTVQPWSLDVRTMKWTRLDPPRPWPEGQCTGRWGVFWYDPHHNVHLLINFVRRDRVELYDGGITETWAYRYARRGGGGGTGEERGRIS
ncbi:MAG: hypothetical protein N2255_01490 [Kiritimatiellae bacterium]|nr:hypothetical protein [Kiritimatiellia bacterium]